MLGCRILTSGLSATKAREVFDVQVAEGVLSGMMGTSRDQGLVLKVPKMGGMVLGLVILLVRARGGVRCVVRDWIGVV
jgi:hypothetical protein